MITLGFTVSKLPELPELESAFFVAALGPPDLTGVLFTGAVLAVSI